ncbi:VWA domain-containing protein [Pseudohongiella sp.]|uniref:VWFA domain-containing protein n=1 Tax=marine sediment metagenome TaxID=412755 RepID=A0A0F9WGX5_9ZZZZ|nr:VWA domain-containing protein [Pseudohongiella sp.]HDZ09042.1 VWA domain-containing protein [Pseudohongiella sp.]HEA62727.1 VWA domain-containing protein [Pseudohongiella sp.]
MTESLTLIQALGQFHFLRPLWLLALIPALFFFSRLWRLDAQGSAWHKVIDQSLLPYLLNANKSTSQRLPLILLIAAWTISVLALAGPTWSKQTQPVQERQEALVIVLDLSLGMFANDQDPNRITVARRKIMDLLDARREGQTGLVVYAGEAHLVTPLTDDSVTIRAMIPALSPNIMPVIGNNPAEAIAMANSLMDDASAVNGRILLITSNVPRDQNAAIEEVLSHNRYPLHIIGVGTPQGAAIPVSNGEFLRDNSGQMVVSVMDRGNLQALAGSLNGRYSDITINASDLETVLSDSLLRGDDDSYLESEEEVELWQDAGPWLLILLLPLCALCFRRGWVLQLGLSAGLTLMMLPSPPAQAQEPSGQDPLEAQPNAPTLITEEDLQEMAIGQGQPEAPPAPRQGFDIRSLWLNRDQRGVHYLEEGDPYTAATLFETPEWQGAATFRAGDYQAAINAFSQGDDIDSIYNLGNALAFAERLEEALAAYDRVLAQDPQHADALKNRQIVEDLLEEQQQQEQEQQEQQEQEEQQQQESQSESESDDSEQDQQQQEQEEQQQQEQSQEQQDEQQQESESENADQGQQRSDAQVEQEEDQESLEQFLRRIEDDPGELLQRKFQFESRRRMIERRTSGQNSQ